MKYIPSTVVLLLLVFGCLVARADKPNVVLVMADDMGWGDTGYNGNRVIKTPNLDRMSREGIRFDRFYAGSSVCSPTRGSCLTGRHPYRYGVSHGQPGPSAGRGNLSGRSPQEPGLRHRPFRQMAPGDADARLFRERAGPQAPRKLLHAGHERLRRVVQHRVCRRHVGSVRSGQLASGQRPVRRAALYWHNGENVKGPLTGCDSQDHHGPRHSFH